MSAHFQAAHFGASHFLSSHFGRGEIIETPVEPVHPIGWGDEGRKQRIIRDEDEVIIALIMAFLEIKDD